MAQTEILVSELYKYIPALSAGDTVLLSGTIYTARDAAHKKLVSLIQNNAPLPFEIDGAVIYYAGPTPEREGTPIGSCGPTTSSRMDVFTPLLLEMGLIGMIGKGPRSEEVRQAIVKRKGIYLCALGGAGALAAQSVKECKVIAFDELGCESVKKLIVDKFPLIVGIDSEGNSLFL